jgi:hypothetical protein
MTVVQRVSLTLKILIKMRNQHDNEQVAQLVLVSELFKLVNLR